MPPVDLIVGSDLIYSEGVVGPLLKTVADYLKPCTSSCNTDVDSLPRSRFILAGSFGLSSQTESIINETCTKEGLVRQLLDCSEYDGLLWLNRIYKHKDQSRER